MIYCRKCGRKLDDKAQFCPGCGEKVVNRTNAGNAAPVSGRSPSREDTAKNKAQNPQPQKADPNSVQYVYVNKKTGKITNNPHVKTGSEGCLQYFLIVFAAVALVIVMVAGSVFLSDYFSEKSAFIDEADEMMDVSSQSKVSSQDISSEVSSEPVSSEALSSQEVSSEPEIPEELTAKYMNKKIKGKWSTDVPYKNMTLPGVFEFDGKGNAKCTIKAFLFSKKFEGSYKIKDGGKCTLTLDGLEEYFDNDTMVGNLKFITDDKIEFTVDNTVWILNRVE